jgi:hypothetical protein
VEIICQRNARERMLSIRDFWYHWWVKEFTKISKKEQQEVLLGQTLPREVAGSRTQQDIVAAPL